MNTKNKKFYDAPQTEILEVKAEGVVCTSGDANATMDGVFSEETI